jgi:hypothetical protein
MGKKKKKKKSRYPTRLDKDSLTMRDLTRHAMPPPSIRMKSKKDYDRKKQKEKDDEHS